MSDVTPILSQIEDGDASAAEQLLPLVYDALYELAAAHSCRRTHSGSGGRQLTNLQRRWSKIRGWNSEHLRKNPMFSRT
jgi:hypothetical protein